MDYDIIILSKADSFLKKISKKDKKSLEIIFVGLDKISKNPKNSEIMKSYFKGARKIRTGDYRIIFEIQKQTHSVAILEIMPRKKDYK